MQAGVTKYMLDILYNIKLSAQKVQNSIGT